MKLKTLIHKDIDSYMDLVSRGTDGLERESTTSSLRTWPACTAWHAPRPHHTYPWPLFYVQKQPEGIQSAGRTKIFRFGGEYRVKIYHYHTAQWRHQVMHFLQPS